MTIYALGAHAPQIHEDTWVAPDANLIGKGQQHRAQHDDCRDGIDKHTNEQE